MKTLKRLLTVAILPVFAVATMKAQSDTLIYLSTKLDAGLNQVDAVVTLTADSTLTKKRPIYVLDSRYYVGAGQTLNIEAGCVIKGTYGIGLAAPALIVSRDATLNAVGTAAEPIIFTTIEDQLDGSYPLLNQGRWGGVIILGRAYHNLLSGNSLWVENGVATIEGLDLPDTRHHFGANLDDGESFNDADNSGSLEYVSIRHGGAVIGEANEINGLTLGGVGSGTTLRNIEVVSNLDDGIEFFGGTVDLKYANILFCDDDYIDWDLGYTGRGQFIYGLQLPASTNPAYSKEGDNGFEIDGDDSDQYNAATLPAGARLSNPTYYNVTLIGNGSDEGIEAKERTQGTIRNSILANFASGLHLNDGRTFDALYEWENNNFNVENNTFDANTLTLKVAGAAPTADQTTTFTGDGNEEVPGVIASSLVINAKTNGVITDVNPVPANAADVGNVATYPADAFFTPVSYRGAFLPGAPAPDWVAGGSLVGSLGLDCPSDLNKDNVTNISDFLLWLPNFDKNCGQ